MARVLLPYYPLVTVKRLQLAGFMLLLLLKASRAKVPQEWALQVQRIVRQSHTAAFAAFAHFATPLVVAGEGGHPAGGVSSVEE